MLVCHPWPHDLGQPRTDRRPAHRTHRPGFYRSLDVLADQNHPGHADIAEWYDDYDPENFNDLPLRIAVGRIASRRRAGTAREAKPGAT